MAGEAASPASPDPQLDLHRAVVGELVPVGLIRLAIRHVAERGAVDPG